jgi:hypothetical protein
MKTRGINKGDRARELIGGRRSAPMRREQYRHVPADWRLIV